MAINNGAKSIIFAQADGNFVSPTLSDSPEPLAAAVTVRAALIEVTPGRTRFSSVWS